MLDLDKDGPPGDVIAGLVAAGLRDGQFGWTRLHGGRTNRLWRFEQNGSGRVLKLYAPGADTPLFPNDARAEAMVLAALAGSGLAPRLCLTFDCASGQALVYEHIPGLAPHDPPATSRALARLHRQKPPSGLRMLAADPYSLLRQGDAIMAMVPEPAAAPIARLRPAAPDTTPFERAFLHGDPVPANVVHGRDGPCFIDWQCPALGDPTEDIALYLSPAMQHLYGGQPPRDGLEAEFLEAYGDTARAARYRRLAPLYHWRMAAYCLWKVSAGDADYAEAAKLELAALKLTG